MCVAYKTKTILFVSVVMLCLLSGLAAEDKKLPVLKKRVGQDDKQKLDWVWQMTIQGPYLFVTVHRDGDIIWFKKDDKTGDLEYIATIDVNKDLNNKKRHCNIYVALSKNIVYVTGSWTHAHGNQHSIGLSWYQLDPENKTTKKLGTITCDAGTIFPSEHPDIMYLHAYFSKAIETIKIDAAGKPSVLPDKITGKGIGLAFALSPDGKNGYSYTDEAAAWIDIQKDGTLKYGGSCDIPNPYGPHWSDRSRTMIVSPDGKHVYAFRTKSYSKDNAVYIFNRDTKSGKLTFNQKQEGKRYQGLTDILFRSDGKSGYFSGGPEAAGAGSTYFTRDPGTGKLSIVKKFSRTPSYGIAFDPGSGTIYTGGFYGSKYFEIYSSEKDPGGIKK